MVKHKDPAGADASGASTSWAPLRLAVACSCSCSRSPVSRTTLTPTGRPSFWGYLAGAALLFVPFVRQERRVADPMVDLHVLRGRPFLSLNLYGLRLWRRNLRSP